MEKQFRATTRELKIRLDYLDQLARDHESKLAALRAEPPSPKRDATIRRIEQKLAFYHAVKQAAEGAARANNARTQPLTPTPGQQGSQPFRVTVGDMLSVKTVEAQAILAGARILIDDLSARMKVVGGVLGKPANYSPQELALVNRIKARAKAAPTMMQRLQMVFQQYGEASAMLTQAEQQFARVKTLAGREALQFLTNTVRAPHLSGKLYHLERLHVEYAGDPDLSQLFPAPEAIDYPAPLHDPILEDPSKPKPKGGLMGLFGLNKK